LQTPSFDHLSLELLKFGYHKVLYLEVSCLRCGDYRVAQDAVFAQGNTVPSCPACGRRAEASPILCEGFSKHETPFHERIKAPLSVNALSYVMTTIDDDDKVAAKVRRQQAGRNGRRRQDRRIREQDFDWESLPRKQWAAMP
jgi:ribosomal protein S27E